MKRFFYPLFSTFSLLIFFIYLYFNTPTLITIMDYKLQDTLMSLRSDTNSSEQIVIIDIDDKSLQTLGQWPWPRDIMARLINELNEAKVRIIAMDIVFAEEDGKSPHKFSTELKQNNDVIFANALSQAPVVGGYYFDAKSAQQNGGIIIASHIQRNLPILEKSLLASGFFNYATSDDGVVREIPLLIEHNATLLPSLALQTYLYYTDEQTMKIEYNRDDAIVNMLKVSNRTIPIDRYGSILINYYGGLKSFTHISLVDILEHRVDVKKLEGKIALVGTSAVGLLDIRATPYNTMIPGVQVHAYAIDNMLKNDFIVKNSDVELINFFGMFVIIPLITLLFYKLRKGYMLLVFVVAVVAVNAIFFALLISKGFVISIVFPVLELILILFVSLLEKVFSRTQ